MSDFTVGNLTDCIAKEAITHPGVGTPIDITVTDGAIAAYIWIYHASVEATANTNPGWFSIQTKGDPAGTEGSWSEVARFTATTTAAALANITATEPVNETTMATTSGEGDSALTDGELVYIEDATGISSGEYHWISDRSPTATTVLLAEGLDFEKQSGDDIWSQADAWQYILSLAGVTEWRVAFFHRAGTGANVHIWAQYREVTDFA